MDASQIPEPSNTIRVGKLLGLDPNELEDALTTKTIFAQGDSVVRIIDDIFTTLFKLYQYFYFLFYDRCRDCPRINRWTCETPLPRVFTAGCLYGSWIS